MKSTNVALQRPEYFEWLCSYISIPGINTTNYISVLNYLFTIPFKEVNSMDVNRIKDAFNLRIDFCREFNISCSDNGPTISVFEVLVALSIRCERDIIGEPGNELWGRLFWDMLHNLSVDIPNSQFNEELVDIHINRWLDRSYNNDGVGGAFPLKKPSSDQTKVELWYQMQSYITENY